MWQHPPVFQHVGRMLQNRLAPITKEPLPERWVELIHYLNEKERREVEKKDRESNWRLSGAPPGAA